MQKKWLKLDNSAKIFPVTHTPDSQSMFAVVMDLKSPVDGGALLNSLEKIKPRYPSLTMCLKRGAFWYYFEENDKPLKIGHTSEYPLFSITHNNENGYNFRVSYDENRITVDFYHVICDGFGAMEFCKSLLYYYFLECGYNVKSDDKVKLITEEPTLREEEDSFLANAEKLKLSELKMGDMHGGKAFHITGEKLSKDEKAVAVFYLPVKEIIANAKKEGVSVSAYLAGLIMYSIYKSVAENSEKKDPIRLLLPINLRGFFDSESIRNFTLFTRCEGKIDSDDYTLSDFCQSVNATIKEEADTDKLRDKISTTAKADSFIPLRLMPLFIKQGIISFSNLFFGKSNKTLTFSNMGKVDLPTSFSEHVDNVWYMLNCNDDTPYAVSAGSFGDKLTVSFVSRIKDDDIEKTFEKELESSGVSVSRELLADTSKRTSVNTSKSKPKFTNPISAFFLSMRNSKNFAIGYTAVGFLFFTILHLINLFTTREPLWSLVVGLALFYPLLLIRNTIYSRVSIGVRVFWQMVFFTALVYTIEFVFKTPSFATDYAVPAIIFLGIAGCLIASASLDFSPSSLVSLISTAMYSLIPLILFLTGATDVLYMPIMTLAIGCFSVLILVVNDKGRIKDELKRRLHF